MNSDFVLGSKLYELQVGNSSLDFPQCLAVIVDDIDLKNAVNNLSLDRIFFNYFNNSCVFDGEKKTEVTTLVDAQLEAPLASRVNDILNGYSSSSVAASQNSLVEQSIRSGEYDSSTRSNPSLVEHATLFASPASPLHNQPSIPSVEAGDPIVRKSKSPILFILLAVLAFAFVGGLGFALFKFEALCEPLGLCDDDQPKENSSNGENLERSGRISEPLPDNNQVESTQQSRQDQNRKDAPPVISPSQSTQSQTDLLPDRDEALW